MNTFINPETSLWNQLCKRPEIELEFLDGSVRNILARVKSGGDKALIELTKQFDGVSISNIAVSGEEIKEAESSITSSLKSAIELASKNIRTFHESQETTSTKIVTTPGVTCWRKTVPIDPIGIYIPGGSAPLFSTVLMLAIPAVIAGCEQIVVCTPPDKNGKIDPAILYAAKQSGVTSIFKVGGAQAIAAMAYGSESILATNKIFGPGNQYVTKAKQLVSMEGTAIDLPAGPSEVLVMADKSATPSFVAADLLSQAEHGEDSQVILVVNDLGLVKPIKKEIQTQLETLPRKEIAQRSLRNARILVFEDRAESMKFINTYAPEHLIINTIDAHERLDLVKNAGSVFLGDLSAEAIGDYASGTNHTLPTNGNARAFGGVSLESFCKNITVQEVTSEGIQNIGEAVETMAEAESLQGHKIAVQLRREKTIM